VAAPSTAVEFDVAVRPLRVLTVLAVVFGTASVLASAWHQDQTSDEPYHMKWARRLLSERVSERASSPLWNSKTPVMAAHVLSKWAGRRLLGVRGRAATFWGRLPGLAAYLGVLTLAYGFGRSRLGERTALLACALLALDPNLIANSAVATVDAPYTLTTLLTLAAGVRMAERPSFGRAALLGAALGLCFATKFTAFLLLPGLLFLLACYGVRALGGGRRALALGSVVALAAVAVLDAAYLGVGVARPLDALTWKSELMGQLAQALPRLRLPLPADFLTGLDICLAHERGRAWPVMIIDRRYGEGVWWYFLASWAFKTPLLLLLAQLFGLARLAWNPPRAERPFLCFLVGNLLLSLAYFSFLFRAQIGYRYVLMCLPLLALLAARGLGTWPVRRLVPAALVVVVGAALELLPYTGNALAFTSPLVQPKERAFRFLTNSSIDWGQNDQKVGPWIRAQRQRDPERVWHFEPTHLRPGRNVIGLNTLAGGGRANQHRYLRRHLQPIGHFRHTYLLFDVDAATYETFLTRERTLAPEADLAGCEGPGGRLEEWRPPAEPNGVLVLCLETAGPSEVTLRVRNGGPTLGPLAWRLRDWDVLRPGERATWRLAPGRHRMGLMRLHLYDARFEVTGGPARVVSRPGRVLDGYLLASDAIAGTGVADRRPSER
jgi:hypothetical protein